jgi:hypothetical protein
MPLLLYPNQGLVFSILVPWDGLGCVCPEMEVASFCYYPPSSLEEVLIDDYLAETCAGVQPGIEENLMNWHGFGGGY